MNWRFLLVLCVVLGGGRSAFGVIYVDLRNNTPGDGTSWATAFLDIQAGIDAAVAAQDTQVWVAEGTYYPGVTIGIGPGIELFGGFPRGGAMADRDPLLHMTTVDGQGMRGCFTASDGTLDGFTVQNGNSVTGAALMIIVGTFTIRQCVFRANTAVAGAAVYCGTGATLTVEESLFTGNSTSSTSLGGALYCLQPVEAAVRGCRFERNTSASGGGGILFSSTGSQLLIEKTSFTGNVAVLNGGGVQCFGGSFTARDCDFAGNTAGTGAALGLYSTLNPRLERCRFEGNVSSGPGIHFYASSGINDATVDSCTFVGNRTGGGVIWCDRFGLVMRDSAFESNVGESAGAVLVYGVYPTTGNLSISRCRFIGNVAGNSGSGAIYAANIASYAVSNCAFVKNSGREGALGIEIIDILPSRLSILGCTFAGNVGTRAGGVHMNNRTNQNVPAAVVNTILWSSVGTPLVASGLGLVLAVDHSTLPNGLDWGATNLETPPLFFDEATGDVRLREDSPCIDAGVDSYPNLTIPATDLLGTPRSIGASYDMGAYEFDAETDTDRDGVADSLESMGDSSGSGIPDWLDASNNPLPPGDINRDGVTNALDIQLVINGALGLFN